MALLLLVCREKAGWRILPQVLTATPAQAVEWLGPPDTAVTGAHCQGTSAWEGMKALQKA